MFAVSHGLTTQFTYMVSSLSEPSRVASVPWMELALLLLSLPSYAAYKSHFISHSSCFTVFNKKTFSICFAIPNTVWGCSFDAVYYDDVLLSCLNQVWEQEQGIMYLNQLYRTAPLRSATSSYTNCDWSGNWHCMLTWCCSFQSHASLRYTGSPSVSSSTWYFHSQAIHSHSNILRSSASNYVSSCLALVPQLPEPILKLIVPLRL